jgi:competence protein ComEA
MIFIVQLCWFITIYTVFALSHKLKITPISIHYICYMKLAEKLYKLLGMRPWEAMATCLLLLLILAIALINYLLPYYTQYDAPVAYNKLVAQIDTENKYTQNTEQLKPLTPKPFNPNTCTQQDFEAMGVPIKTIMVILNYRNKGGKFYSKADVAKMYTLSDVHYKQLEPYILLPNTADKNNTYADAKPEIKVVEVNSADTAALNKLPGIGAATAYKIIQYRDAIGGFYSKQQLVRLVGEYNTFFSKALPYITINKNLVKPIPINTIGFIALSKHTLVGERIALAICKYRKGVGSVANMQVLQSNCGISDSLASVYLHYFAF